MITSTGYETPMEATAAAIEHAKAFGVSFELIGNACPHIAELHGIPVVVK